MLTVESGVKETYSSRDENHLAGEKTETTSRPLNFLLVDFFELISAFIFKGEQLNLSEMNSFRQIQNSNMTELYIWEETHSRMKTVM